MRPCLRLSLLAVALLCGFASSSHPAGTTLSYMAARMDQFHRTLDVYTDADAAGNHFVARGAMGYPAPSPGLPPAMDEAWCDNPHSGIDCIRAEFDALAAWSGWYFMNGRLAGAMRRPRPNWGTAYGAGLDLRGATRLTFWARGQQGGERVEFFCLGVGWDPDTGQPEPGIPFPGSSPKISTGYITLTPNWNPYVIDVSQADLSYVLGGFGWVSSRSENGGSSITFYLDDIQYDLPRLDEPRLIVSYRMRRCHHPFDVTQRNAAFSYDNAVTLLAFLARGGADDMRRAKLLADALVYAHRHDRYYGHPEDGRLRNAYQGGELALWPGWTPNGRRRTVRMPGFMHRGHDRWYEDEFHVSTHTGNIAWPMIALLAYFQRAGGHVYLKTARELGEWVETHCRDSRGAGGYTGGYQGWEPAPAQLLYKSTEHNIDLYVAFSRLYEVTGNLVWQRRAQHAYGFVDAMWHAGGGKFWTGTKKDGVTPNRQAIPLDCQAWFVLATRGLDPRCPGLLQYMNANHRVGCGYDFDTDRDGVWYEGTAHVALANRVMGKTLRWRLLLDCLHAAQRPSGGLPAASKNNLTTGFDWVYFNREHTGATAWLALAELGENPFWLGSSAAATETHSLDRALLTSLAAVPTAGGSQVMFSLSGPASVYACIRNIAGRPVRTLCRATGCDAGANTLLWDARSDTGLVVPNGVYLIEVQAQSPDGAQSKALTQVRVSR